MFVNFPLQIPMSKLHGLMVAWNKYSKEGKNEGKNHENAIYEALRVVKFFHSALSKISYTY